MHTPEDEYPWVFGRDDIDLLEDEIEDLFQQFGRGANKTSDVEVQVLQEQVETEERSDAELAERLGLSMLEPRADSTSPGGFHSSATSSPQIDNMRLHPLYQRARAWAQELRAWSKAAYETGTPGKGDVFRVYANVNLVPIKLFTGLHEEQHGDAIGLEVAEQEYQLALTYLERIIESLTLVLVLEEGIGPLVSLRGQAEELRAIVVGQLAAVRRKKGQV